MIGYVENLERLGFPLGKKLATDLILQSLPYRFSQFALNFNINDMDKSLPELLAMLRTAEENLKTKGKSILMIGNGRDITKGPPSRVIKGKARKLPNPNPPLLL